MSATAGSVVRLTYDLVDVNGSPVNPATASVTIFDPNGAAVVSPTVTLPPVTTGHLIADYASDVAKPGRYSGYWTTTNPITTKGFVFNLDSQTTIALIALDDAKQFLNIDAIDTTDDDELTQYIEVASYIADKRVGACAPRTVTERCEVGSRLVLRYGPPMDDRPISIVPYLGAGMGETVDVSLTKIDHVTWMLDRIDGTGFYWGPYAVTYRIGRAIVSPVILQGVRVLLSHLWETQRGASMVGPASMASGPVGSEDVTFAVKGHVWSVPRAVLELLDVDGTPLDVW